MDNNSSYKSIFKATSLFGGVQVYKILIQIIKAKVIAVLLGPVGVGIMSLLSSATDVIRQLTALGLGQSAVRDVASANSSGDFREISLVVTVLRKLVWLTGLIGSIIVLVLAPLLSHFSFGNYNYTIPFMLLSVTLLLEQLSSGQSVILQGLRKWNYLAKSSVYGSTIGLLVSVPLYYWFGINGIVPTLILNYATMLLLSWWFSRKIPIVNLRLSVREILNRGKGMVQLGVAMSISGILVSLCAYILRSFIRVDGDVIDVGIFNAGFMLMSTYTGLVFSAMGTDYYPRLSAICKDNLQCKEVINQQAEIGLLIISPLLVTCVTFAPIIVPLLYSSDFLPVNTYIVCSSIGMLFKMTAWSMSFVFIAKGESKLFIFNEVIANITTLALNILGYKLDGITGLGLSFTLSNLIYAIQVYIICRSKYNFRYSQTFLFLSTVQFFFVILSILLYFAFENAALYITGSLLLLTNVIFSYRELNKRIGLTKVLLSKLKRGK